MVRQKACLSGQIKCGIGCEPAHSCLGQSEQYSFGLCIRVEESLSLKQEFVIGKCANNSCSIVRSQNAGRLFRLDLDIGSKSGAKGERKVEYLWLCTDCAQVMQPKVEVRGDTVTLKLTKIESIQLETFACAGDRATLLKQAN